MPRRFSAILLAISLSLCAACLFMWVRSGFAHDYITRQADPRDQWTLSSLNGNLFLIRQWYVPSDPGLPPQKSVWSGQWQRHWSHQTSQWYLDRPQFQDELLWANLLIIGHNYTLRLPYWLLLFVSLAVPEWQICRWGLRQWRGNRHEQTGRCRTCGYDLRATPTRCPECGAEVVKTERL